MSIKTFAQGFLEAHKCFSPQLIAQLVAPEGYEPMQCLHAAMFGHQVPTDPLWDVGHEQEGT